MDDSKLDRAIWYESVVTNTICQKARKKYGALDEHADTRSFLRTECQNFGITSTGKVTNKELAGKLQIKAKEYVSQWCQDQLGGQNGRLREPRPPHNTPRVPMQLRADVGVGPDSKTRYVGV